MTKRKYFFYVKAMLCLLILSLQLSEDFIYLKFATSPLNFVIKKTSSLSSLSFGYGNYFPLLTFLLILICLFTTFISNWKRKVLFYFNSSFCHRQPHLHRDGYESNQHRDCLDWIGLIYLLLLILLGKDGDNV